MPVKSTLAKASVALPVGQVQRRTRRRRNDSSSDVENVDTANSSMVSNISCNTSIIRNADTTSPRLHQTLDTTVSNTTSRSAASQGRKILSLVSPVIEKVQMPGVNMDEALQKIEKIYKENDKRDFPEVLWRIMIVPFQAHKGNEKTDRIIKFFHKIVTSVGNDYKTLGSLSLSFRILRLCVKYHREKRIIVRFRVAETVVKILESFGTEDVLAKEIKELILEVLLERIRDKHHSVRTQSAMALGLLQISSDFHKSIRRICSSLTSALTSDPHHEVRKAALTSLPIERSTIEYLVQKVTDKNDSVKVAALSVISSKIPIRTFTISQRECILQSSLNNSCVAVKNQGIVVLKKWLESCQGNLCELLHKLDVIENEKLCYLILDTLFPEANAENFDAIDKSFMDGKLIAIENLNVEKTFLWLFMIRKFCTDMYYRDKLIAAPNDMFEFVKSFLAMPIAKDSDSKKEECHVMLRHIMRILKYLQLEEGSRGQMKEIINRIYQSEHLSLSHINLLVQLLHLCWLDEKDDGLMNVVNSVLDESAKAVTMDEPRIVLSEDEIMSLKIELATTMHTRHKRKRDMDDAACQNDFIVAQQCHIEIAELFKKETEIKNKLQSCNETEMNKLDENSEDEEEVEFSPTALCIALSTIIAHLQITKRISPLVRHFYEHQVVSNMHKFVNPRLRQKALKLMTLVGFQNFEDAEMSMIFCIQGVMRDEHFVRVEALKCMFDLVLQYGFEEFEALPKVVQLLIGSDRDHNLSQAIKEEDLSPLRLLTLSFIGSLDTELLHTSVEGVIKLLLGNRFHSPRVVYKLLLTWANPVNLQTKIYKDVQQWLPIYANTGVTQGKLIANALVPCILKILSSKRSSPLSDASIESLSAFVLQSTDQKTLDHNEAHTIHQAIALNVLEEMKEHLATPKSIDFARILKQLDLKNCDVESLSEMIKLSKFLSNDPNRHVRTIMTDFIQYLKLLGGSFEDENSDGELEQPPHPAGPQQSVRENCYEDSINVNEVFSSSESEEEEESRESTIVTRSPIASTTAPRLSQQSLRSLRSSRMCQPSALSPIISDDCSSSDDDSSDGIYGPTPPL